MISEASLKAEQYLKELAKEDLIDDSPWLSAEEMFGSGDYDSQGSGEASYGDNGELLHEREAKELKAYVEGLEREVELSKARVEIALNPSVLKDGFQGVKKHLTRLGQAFASRAEIAEAINLPESSLIEETQFYPYGQALASALTQLERERSRELTGHRRGDVPAFGEFWSENALPTTHWRFDGFDDWHEDRSGTPQGLIVSELGRKMLRRLGEFAGEYSVYAAWGSAEPSITIDNSSFRVWVRLEGSAQKIEFIVDLKGLHTVYESNWDWWLGRDFSWIQFTVADANNISPLFPEGTSQSWISDYKITKINS